MIFIHLLLGIILGNFFGNYFFFILGSLFPDFDHLYIIIKNKIWNSKKIIETIKYEDKFNLKYKTKLFHSILGLVLFSLIAALFNAKGAIIFAIMYLLHLLMDWADIDEKYYLYPLKIKFKGFLPIWSKYEKLLTIILLILTSIILFV